MTKQEFYKKHRHFIEDIVHINTYFIFNNSSINTQDVLTRIAGAISNLHIEKNFLSPKEMDKTLNGIKEYIFDYQDLLKAEEKKSLK